MARFRLTGETDGIHIPELSGSERRDDLWQTTCFEIFWQAEGEEAYREFNLSPSLEWAAYDFDSHRRNGRDAPVKALAISCGHDHQSLMLVADISADLPMPARISLSAVIHAKDGSLQYWALAFCDGHPDFHSHECRVLSLSVDRAQ